MKIFTLMKSFFYSFLRTILVVTPILVSTSACNNSSKYIIIDKDASEVERYSAAELQRYLYQLSGELLEISTDENVTGINGFVLGEIGKNRLITQFSDEGVIDLKSSKPGKQGYLLKKIDSGEGHVIVIAGADPEGCLYGVYGLLDDHYGMGFYLSGDTYPEKTSGIKLVAVDEQKTPMTSIRGVLPWTNFPQAATSYSWEDWTFLIDQMARMRMNFIHIHNYSGGAGHNEMFANFEYKGYWSRVWMATAMSGHGWSCPGWEVNKYLFGSADLFDDYDFGADCALHNETLSNKEVLNKGVSEFQRVIEYAHLRGVKIGLGLDINQIPEDYQTEAGDPLVVKARAEQIANDYPNLDYLLCFQSENIAHNEVARLKWRGIFDTFYNEIKKKSLPTRVAVSGWGLAAKDVATLPEDVICAPIAPYTAGFESGAIYGNREYWGCPWLEKDGDCSQYYYPYTIHLSNTIEDWQKRATNMTGFYALTWRITDAIDPKISFIAKAPWDQDSVYHTSEDVYREYAEDNYGKLCADAITDIINENEPWVDSQGECRPTLAFSEKAKRGRANICKMDYFQFLSEGRASSMIQAESFNSKDGWVRTEVRRDGTKCIGGINSADWLSYEGVDFGAGMTQINYRIASRFFNACFELRIDSLEGELLQICPVNRTNGWDRWREMTIDIKKISGVHTVYLVFHPAPVSSSEIVKAGQQIAEIDRWLKEMPSPINKYRLQMLRCRIAATRDNLILNRDFVNYQWKDLPGRMESLIDNFNFRVNDISSLGNIISVQNRFVFQNYLEKVEQLMADEPIRPITNISVKGTPEGVVIRWKYDLFDVTGFNVYRDGKKVNERPLSSNIRTWSEKHDGECKYSVSVVDFEGTESLPSIPIGCPAGEADNSAPVIVLVSPPTSVLVGQDAWFKVRLLDKRDYDFVCAELHYRVPGDKNWMKKRLSRRNKSIFTFEIKGEDISHLGIEYFVVASDGRNESRFPSEGNLSFSVYQVPYVAKPLAPTDVKVVGSKISWKSSATKDVVWYRIYRSRNSDCQIDPATYLTYVEKSTTSFYDNGYDLDGETMEGKWYYRITSVDKMGFESEASLPVELDSKNLIEQIRTKQIRFIGNESFSQKASRAVM